MLRQGHRDADTYRRYAVGLYRQALFGALPHVRASRLLRGLIASPAAAAVEDGNRTRQTPGEK